MMRLPLILFSLILLSNLFDMTLAKETSLTAKTQKNSDRTKSFDVDKFRCILKVIYQRLLEKDMDKVFYLEEKQDKFTSDDEKQISTETINRVNNLDSYLIKLRSFLLQIGEWKNINPVRDLNDVSFIRIFNQIFIDFNNFKQEYKDN